MRQEEALTIIVNWLGGRPGSSELSHFGYDLYLPNLIRWYLRSEPEQRDQFGEQRCLDELFPIFADAAWELCIMGILRPGIRKRGAQVTDEGNGGSGFSVTNFGRAWLTKDRKDTSVPAEPDRFGPGFHERAQQAARCYGAHAYAACCAMCGAAAESILLATAIAKIGDEEKVLGAYASTDGGSRLENMVIGQAAQNLQREFHGLTELLKYWRDEVAHGRSSGISDNEAYTSLTILVRHAMFIHRNWSDFVRKTA